MFEDLGLRALYTTYEEEAYTRINALIDKVPEKNYGGPVSDSDEFSLFVAEKVCAGDGEAGYFP